ncbi:MAG TPA: hemin ABC transporter ATP-binding protein [Deltaproteobacteria bacterium]|jgi:iron complex transport system ATP-binding protein|nr:hemin ABC transporter ATP-binding protein [Deltaproteobacteria bacterium]
MSELVLGFEAVRLQLGGRSVLQGVDLVLFAGEILGLLGANGAGKTSLLRIATGVLAPDDGAVRLFGRPVGEFSRAELARRIALVPQRSEVPFPYPAAEIVRMGRAPHLGLLGFESREDVAIAERAMEEVGIRELAGRSILELSGGEQQLVAIARGLVQATPILLLDEPTAFLDLRHRVHVLRLVRGLARAGRAVLVVSHDLGLAARFCDRLALLSGGHVLAAGSPAEVLTPSHLAAAFGIEATVLRAPDGTPIVLPEGDARGREPRTPELAPPQR